MRRIKLFSLLILGLVLVGCATVELKKDFYGINMNSVQNAKDFKIVSYSLGEVSYSKNNQTMNPDIYAFAEVDSRSLVISVTNNSKNPIGTNYFSDDFELTDKDDRVFKIEKEDFMFYPKVDYINPGKTVEFPLKNPFDYDGKLKNGTAMIVCTLGTLSDRVTIVLKPLPEEQNTSTNKK